MHLGDRISMTPDISGMMRILVYAYVNCLFFWEKIWMSKCTYYWESSPAPGVECNRHACHLSTREASKAVSVYVQLLHPGQMDRFSEDILTLCVIGYPLFSTVPFLIIAPKAHPSGFQSFPRPDRIATTKTKHKKHHIFGCSKNTLYGNPGD